MNVGEYTVFTIGNPFKEHENSQFFLKRIHKLNVGEYTVCSVGNPLRSLRIYSFGGEYTS